jgi:uncharacterized protein (TIGR03435 family)
MGGMSSDTGECEDKMRKTPLWVALVSIVGVLSPAASRAQSKTSSRLEFEVSSVRPNRSGDIRTTAVRPSPAGGTYTADNQSVSQLIRQAYSLKPFQLEGGPKWIDDFGPDKYDIVAKAAGPVMKDQLLLMLRTLLEDRFKLKYHFETRQLPIYALVVASKGVLGPNLRKSNADEPRLFPIRQSPGGMDAVNATMQDLAWSLSSFTAGRLVLDRTGLADHFAFTLEFTPDAAALPRPAGIELPPRVSSGPSLFQALPEQLGLKLESAKGPVEVLIVDSAEKPTEN